MMIVYAAENYFCSKQSRFYFDLRYSTPNALVHHSKYGSPPVCLNNTIFSNLGLCAACWAHFMCHHELWPTTVSHPFSSLNNSLGFTGGKQYQKITIPVFRLVLQNFAIPGCFPYIPFYCYLFSLLSSGWFVFVACGFVSVKELVKHLESL